MIRPIVGLIASAWMLLALPLSRAQEQPQTDAPQFRRVLVPDGVEPDSVEQLTPMRAADFEQLVAAASGAAQPPRARIEEARYECRLVEPAGLLGSATLRVAVDGAPALVWLEPCNVAIRSLTWDTPTRPLRWGRTSDGRTALLADASGELRIEWSSAGTRLPLRGVAFNLELPQAPVARLSVQPASDYRIEWRTANGTLIEPLSGAWPLREPRGSLQFSPAQPQEQPTVVGFRENNLYELSPRGLSLAAEWTFDVRGGSLPRLTLDVDFPLRLLSARYGEQELAMLPREVAGGGQRVELALDGGLEGGNRVVTLAAVSDRTLDAAQPLPRLRAVDCFWQQGESTIRVVAPQSLASIEHQAGRTVRIAPLTAPTSGAAWDLQHFAPDWSATLRAARTAPAEARTATEVVCGRNRHLAVCRTTFRGLSPGMNQISIASPGAWRILRIEQDGAARAPCDWEQSSAGPSGSWRVNIPSVRAGEDLVLRIEADHQAGPLSAAELQPWQWPEVENVAAEIALRSAEGMQLDIRGDESVEWRRTESLSSVGAPLVPFAPGGWSTDARRLPEALRVEAVPLPTGQSTYRWQVTVSPNESSIGQEYDLTLASAVAASRTIDVQFEPPTDSDLNWSLAGAPPKSLSARRLDAVELAELHAAADAEIWRIELPAGPIGEWRLRSVRSSPHSSSMKVGFPRVLDAKLLGGELLVKDSGQLLTTCTVRGLESASRGELLPGVAGRYVVGADELTPPSATINADAKSHRVPLATQRGWLRLGERGRSETEYAWSVDGRSSTALTLELPEPADAARLTLDGREAALNTSGATRLTLPPQPSCRVALQVARSPSLPLPWRRLSPIPVEIDAITTTTSWRVELPSEWLLVSPRLARVSDEGVASIFEWPTERPPVLWVVRRDFLAAVSVIGALLGAALGAGRWRPARTILTIGLALAAWLIVPTPLAVAPLALLGGWALGTLARAFAGALGHMISTRRGAVGWAAGAILLTLIAEAPGQPAVQPPRYEVLIPIDEQRRPRPDGWLVPEPLLDALLTASTATQVVPRGVWIERADYRGNLLWADGGQPELRLTAVLRVHNFADESWLRLPWSPARVSAAQVTIDGSLAETANDADQLRVRLPGQGTYDVTIPLAPAVQTVAAEGAAELALPSVPASRLELQVSPDLHVTAPSARGLIEQDVAGHRFLADLGSATRLSLRWTTEPRASDGPEVEADQWLLLEIRPGAVLVRTKIAYRVQSGAMSELRFTADPRLRWLPLTQDGVATATLAPSPLDPTAATVPLVQPVAGPWTFQATLLLTGHSGIGQLAWPRLEPRDVALRRRYVAVSIDPALTGDIETAARRGERGDFESAWGERLAPGAEFFETTTDNWPDAVVRTHPQETEPRVLQRLRHFVEREQPRWELSVRWPVGEPRGVTCRIKAPPEVEIDRLELRTDDGSQRLRFARLESGEVEAALEGDAGPEAELVAVGHSATDSGPVALPRITLAGAALLENSVEVWRKANQRLSPIDDHERRLDPASAPLWQGDWRRVANYASPNLVPAEVTLTTAEPQIKLTQALVQGAPSEPAQCLIRVDDADAPLEQLEWEFAADWDGPLTCTPDAEIAIVERPTRRLLRARFRRALQAGDVINIGGLRAPDSRTVPALTPKAAAVTDEVLVFTDPSAVWNLQGWQTTTRPANFKTLPQGAVYRAEGSSPTQLQPNPSGHSPRIAWAEYRIHLPNDDRWLGQMTWLVDPLGSDRLRFRVDGPARFEAVRCDGSEVVAESDGTNQFSVPLASRTLPQRLDLLLVGEASGAAQGSIVAPWPLEAGVADIHWLVRSVDGSLDATPRERLPLGATALARWQADIDLLNQAAPVIAPLRAERQAAWLSEAGAQLRTYRLQAQDVAAAPAWQRTAAAESDLRRRWPELNRVPTTTAPLDWIPAERMVEFKAGEKISIAPATATNRRWTRPLVAMGLVLLSLTLAWRFRESPEPTAPRSAESSAT